MNTHQKFQTVNHHHLDWLYENGDEMESPESALMLVQAGDGRWFLEQEFGDEFDQFPGVVKSPEDIGTEPAFYEGIEAAARAAVALMKQVYPYEESALTTFLADMGLASQA